eukprot:TRINITY_DN37858_c0_g1_i1.p1 TRINITY_DN37858_c0_g1~~TRINITY_DN37858_c0_g1_i1.p1  ORF type:complete len:711 (-),score=81.48 TRINITY_DN37858_c0_g1_i1:158-2290(-)
MTQHQSEDFQDLKSRANELFASGEHELSAEMFRRAIDLLGDAATPEVAALHGNRSAALLNAGMQLEALRAAEDSIRADENYCKGAFRKAKALLALGRLSEAAVAAWRVVLSGQPPSAVRPLFEAINEAVALKRCAAKAAADATCKILRRPLDDEGENMLQQQSVKLEALAGALKLAATRCEPSEVVRLFLCSRRLHQTLGHPDFLLNQAASYCPRQAHAWSRVDLLRNGVAASHVLLLHSCCSSSLLYCRNRLAVVREDSAVFITHALPNGGDTIHVKTFGKNEACLLFSLAWSRCGSYLAFTTSHALVVAQDRRDTWNTVQTIEYPLPRGYLVEMLRPSPCGTRMAVQGIVKGKGRDETKFIAIVEMAQAAIQSHKRVDALPPVSLRIIARGSRYRCDWSPEKPELLVMSGIGELFRLDACTACEAGEEGFGDYSPQVKCFDAEVIQSRVVRCVLGSSGVLCSPQWLPCGRWLVAKKVGAGRDGLVVVDPNNIAEPTPPCDVVCGTVPYKFKCAASECGRWVAWSAYHDTFGHEGVFARRLPSASDVGASSADSKPLFILGRHVTALSWGGNRLAMLLSLPPQAEHESERYAWAAWDPPTDDMFTNTGRILVSPTLFIPYEHSAVLYNSFDQFAAGIRIWSPQNDALVYTDVEGVWVQPLPPLGAGGDIPARDHPAWQPFFGAASHARLAPPPQKICDGIHAVWQPNAT